MLLDMILSPSFDVDVDDDLTELTPKQINQSTRLEISARTRATPGASFVRDSVHHQ